MRKTTLAKAAFLTVAAAAGSGALAQSSLTIYGNIDVGIDNVHKGDGYSIVGAPAASSTVTRVSSSLSSVNAIGFKGTEELGDGYKASFVLEGQFQVDTGAQSGQDGRMWGRQAYVGLTTPVGEIRLGRQYAPMFYAFATTTVEALGGSDIQGAALQTNNLQVRQDNQISYWLKLGGLTAEVSYSPNSGVDSRVSGARASLGTASGTNGQILGGITAGNENSTGRGRTYGLFLNYAFDFGLQTNFSYHSNKFGDAVLGGLSSTGAFVPAFNMDRFNAYSIGAKYVLPGAGTQFSGIFHQGKYTNDGAQVDPRINSIAIGVKQPVGNFAFGAQYAQMKFSNFTKGKDSALMLIGDYNFSKRTKIYTRIGFMKDDRGTPQPILTPGLSVNGGPFALLTGLGALETPFFAGGNVNTDARTTVFSVGVRHQF